MTEKRDQFLSLKFTGSKEDIDKIIEEFKRIGREIAPKARLTIEQNDEKYEEKLIKDAEAMLAKEYPIEDVYCSKATLWECGLKDELVPKELYDSAKRHYGRLWNYTGD
jgi:hypothetical protein